MASTCVRVSWVGRRASVVRGTEAASSGGGRERGVLGVKLRQRASVATETRRQAGVRAARRHATHASQAPTTVCASQQQQCLIKGGLEPRRCRAWSSSSDRPQPPTAAAAIFGPRLAPSGTHDACQGCDHRIQAPRPRNQGLRSPPHRPTLPITMDASCSWSVVAAFEYSGFSFCGDQAVWQAAAARRREAGVSGGWASLGEAGAAAVTGAADAKGADTPRPHTAPAAQQRTWQWPHQGA